MSTLMDVVTGALTAIGQLGQGQTPNAEDGALGLRLANLLLSKWSTKRVLLYNVNTRTYALAASTADYTVGPTGATFTDSRPTFIESAQIQVPATGAYVPLSVLSKAQWDAIRSKDAVAAIPDDIWVEYSYPNLGFHVNPAPTGTPNIRLGCWEQLTQFTTLFTAIAFPPGYEEMLESNLAIEMAPYYDQPIPSSLVQRAMEAMAFVTDLNARTLGGALGEAQILMSPNVGQPAAPQQPGGPPA